MAFFAKKAGFFSGGDSAGYTDKLRKRFEEDAANRQYSAEILKQEEVKVADQKQAEVNSKKSVKDRFGDIAIGTGRFVKGAALDVKNSAVDTWQGLGDVARGELASNEMEKKTEQRLANSKEWNSYMQTLNEGDWNKPEVQAKLKEFSEKNKTFDTSQQSVEDMATAQKVDAKKTAFAAGDTALNIATLGIGTAALAPGKAALRQGVKVALKQAVKTGGTEALEQIIKQGGEIAAKQALKEAAESGGKSVIKKLLTTGAKDALIGAGYGITQTGKNDPNASLEDYAKNIAIGSTVGLVLPFAGAGGKKLIKSAPVKAVDNFVTDIASKSIDKVSSSAIGKKVGDITEKVSVALGDSLAPVMRDFKGIVDKTTGRTVNEELRLLDGNVTNSAAITRGRLQENDAFKALAEMLSPDETKPGSLRASRQRAKELGDFISQKQEAINAKKMGKNIEIPIGTAEQERAYDLLNKSTKHDIQYAYDHDLITEANYKKYMADKDYTRVQRDMSEEIDRSFKGVGGANASISSTPFQQRLKGSGGKKAVDPFVAYYDWSDKVTRAAERQKLSNYIIEQRQLNGLGKGFLRKADDVEARLAARGEAAQLRVLRNGLSKVISSESKYGRRLQQELDRLNTAGLNTALKKGGKNAMPEFTVEGLGGKTPTGKVGNKLGPRDTKQFVKNLVDVNVKDLEAIKRKIANREPKLAKHIDNIIELKQEHEIVSKSVRELNDLARMHRDQAINGRATIKTFKRGIKEVYEDDPRIVDAINKVGRVELHALLKIAQAPSKVIQRTATAMNFVFTASNLAKDQVSSFVLSKNARATHNPISFMMGLKEAALKPTGKALLRGVGARQTAERMFNPSKEYAEFLKFVAGQTRTDITRNMKSTARAAYEALGLKNENIVRKVENINSATENLTRFQNYFGTYKNALKKGLDPDTAMKNAVQAARENSVDFSRSGDWAPFLKIFNPFANANIQGARSLGRAFKERPIGTSLKVGTAVMTPVALASYYNLSDEKRALLYTSLSDADRENNLVFITDSGSVFKVPLAPGIKEMARPIREMVEAEYAMGDTPSFVQTAKSLFIDPFNPFGPGDIVPQFSKPIVENVTNHSFFTGKEVVPQYLRDKAPDEQVYKGTSQTYRDIGKKFGVSPLMVRNIITGYASSVGEQTVSLYDQLRKAGGATNDEGKPIVTDNRNTAQQLQGKFYETKPDTMNEAKSQFFERYSPAKKKRDTVSAEVTSLVKAGRRNEAKRKAEEYNSTLKGTFSGIQKYGWDNTWDEMLSGLFIKTTENSFDSRERQK